jgi:hypothetical protein
MPIVERLQRHLEEHRVRYEALTHAPAFTAQEIAALQHVEGRDFAKVVMAEAAPGPADFAALVQPVVADFTLVRDEEDT